MSNKGNSEHKLMDYEELIKRGAEISKKAVKERKSSTQGGRKSNTPKEGSAILDRSSKTLCRCLEDVQSKPIPWLWPGRIACGKVTLIGGDPGLGKSQITAALAAVVTQGGIWPVDGSTCEPGAVLFLTAEDDAADTLRPRLEAVGADLRHCHILDGIQDVDETGALRSRGFNLKADLVHLASQINEIGNVRLLVIDPITAYLGGIDSHKNADVRALLAPLSDLAEAHGLAILGITHLNKSNAQDPLQRINGSLAFVAASRGAMIVVKDRKNPARRLLLPLKNNLAKDSGGLAFSVQGVNLESGIETSRIVWENEAVTITADEIMNGQAEGEESGYREEARRFLLELLEGGPMATKEVREEAKEAGFSWRTIERAKKDLGVKAKKSGAKEGWFWMLAKTDNDSPPE